MSHRTIPLSAPKKHTALAIVQGCIVKEVTFYSHSHLCQLTAVEIRKSIMNEAENCGNRKAVLATLEIQTGMTCIKNHRHKSSHRTSCLRAIKLTCTCQPNLNNSSTVSLLLLHVHTISLYSL